VAALAQFVSHHERMRGAKATTAARPEPMGATRMLNEAQSLARVAAAGVPVVAHRLCASADEAVRALASLGGPVAVKGCSRDVAHKSELGLVRLRLGTEAEVRAAFADLRRALESGGFTFDGVLVARMASGRRELLIGAHVDAVFGPVVLIGDGGKYVEAMPDTRVLLPPFDADDVERALARLRIAPLLAGTRGEPPLDSVAFTQAVLAVGALLEGGAGARIASLDLNPVLVGAAGEGCVALDAVVFEESAG
jgi:acyl-CoA synthetase (NDP forming)